MILVPAKLEILSKIYHSKLLLFGEFTLMLGSEALAIPFKKMGGSWVNNPSLPDHGLVRFIDWLSASFKSTMDVERMRSEINNGLRFDSSIPFGYGLGSSGALCAGVVDRFGISAIKQYTKEHLQSLFSEMEAYFHGKSSGFDPLVSYLDQMLVINNHHHIEAHPVVPSLAGFFLLDTGINRKSQQFIDIFLGKLTGNTFSAKVTEKLIPLVNGLIDDFQTGNEKRLSGQMAEISAFHFDDVKELIPGFLHDVWRYGIESGKYSLKINGAGGGGFVLGYSNISEQELKSILPYKIIMLAEKS